MSIGVWSSAGGSFPDRSPELQKHDRFQTDGPMACQGKFYKYNQLKLFQQGAFQLTSKAGQ